MESQEKLSFHNICATISRKLFILPEVPTIVQLSLNILDVFSLAGHEVIGGRLFLIFFDWMICERNYAEVQDMYDNKKLKAIFFLRKFLEYAYTYRL